MADIDIVNAALSKLGEQPLLAMTDASVPGRLANRTYEDIKDALVREFPWNFAMKRTSLAADPVAPAWGFAYKFNLPGDCMRVVDIENDYNYDWRVEGGTIVTDLSAPLNIRYVGDVLEGAMEATFREALAARLAMEWAEPLSATTSLANSMATLYKNKLQVARAADGQEDRLRAIDVSLFIDSRY